MKVTCEKKDLLSGLNIALRAVASKSTMPILECVLVEASDTVKITANDTEIGIETYVSGDIKEGGAIAIDAKMLNEIVRKLPNASVTLSTDPKTLVINISCGKAKFSISGREPDSFLGIPDVDEDYMIELPQYALKEIIRQTLFSAAANDNNRMMMGELFEIKDGILRVIALDGHRVAIREMKLEANICPDVKVVVPGKTLGEMLKILGDSVETVKVYFSKNHMYFAIGDTKITTRLIEGDYFKVEQLFGAKFKTKVTVNKQDLSESVNRATVLIREADKKPLIFDLAGGIAELSAQTSLGSIKEDLEVEQEGEDIRIGFNPKFILDALAAIDDNEVTLEMINTKSPCHIRNEEEGYTYVVLPVNIS